MSEEKEKPKPHYYAIIPASVRYDKRLVPSARILYGEITALCNEKGYCWASNGYFMGLYEASKQTIINWLNALEKYGYIFIEMVFKDNSKELDQRRIYISDPMLIENIKRANFTPPGQNNLTPPGKKNYTTRGKNNLTIPGKDILTHNNTSSFNTTFINISSIEEAKKYFSDKDYKSDPEMFWLKKGKRTKPKDRVDEADAWELVHRNMFPEKHKTTLNSANSESTVAQSEPISEEIAKIRSTIKLTLGKNYDSLYKSFENIEKTETGFIVIGASKKVENYREILQKLNVELQINN